MMTVKMSSAIVVAVAAMLAGSSIAASAQDSTGAPRHARKLQKGYASRVTQDNRPLTVTAPPSPGLGTIVTAPIAVAGQIATAPLNGLSQAFGYGPIGGPSRPLPIVARYAGVGPVTDSVNQGWAQPVPVSANGPIYKLEPAANNGGVSPFALIAAPITAATTLAAAPINAAGALVGGPPAPQPTF
jgi:hypothetical protein